MNKLNLGCGKNLLEGYINVDYYNKKADVIHDLNKYPYPLIVLSHITAK